MKYLGLLFLFVSFLIVGRIICDYLKIKVKKAEEICNLIKYIKNQIEFFNRPLKNIFEKYNEKNENQCIINLNSLENYIPLFGKNGDECFCDMIKSLGKGNREEQLKLLEYTDNVLGSITEDMKKELENKIKLVSTLCVITAMLIILLLL